MPENQAHQHPLSESIGQLETRLNGNTTDCSFATLLVSPGQDVSFLELLDRARNRTDLAAPMLATESSSNLDNPWNRKNRETTTHPSASDVTQPQSSSIRWLIDQAKLCCEAPDSPIVAVMGLLNAGKSSLVSTFLSEVNRQRILVGSANAQGTHRFVLWIPESWRQNSIVWSFVLARLRSIFGCECELLADSPEAASKQYNDTQPRAYLDSEGHERFHPTIEIPLVATDLELDRWGIAIMDCPDVQTGLLPDGSSSGMSDHSGAQGDQMLHEKAQSVSELRWRVLQTAAPLCSAFVVVLPANAIHDQTVSRLMRLLQQQMATVRQIVAVNRVPRKYTSLEISQDIQKIYSHHAIDRTYMAYGFDGPLERQRIPEPPAFYKVPELQTLPLFFRIDQTNRVQPPERVPNADWLLSLGGQLDKRNLASELLRSTLLQLTASVREGIRVLERREHEMKDLVFKIQGTIAQACFEFSSEKSKNLNLPTVRLQASKQIVQQISDSLERTAPWWARPGRWANQIAKATQSSLSKARERVVLPDWMRGTQWLTGKADSVSKWIRSKWSSGESGRVVTADQLVNHLRQFDKSGALGLDRFSMHQDASESHTSLVAQACQRAIQRFQNDSCVVLDEKQLDDFTRQVWSDMPIAKRVLTGLAPAGILFAPLMAVILMPLDFGGSAVLVYASLKELLFAGVTSVGLMLASADSMPKIAEAEVAWRQLGDLIAVVCDELGVRRPRESDAIAISIQKESKPISISQIGPKKPEESPRPSAEAPLLPTEFKIHSKTVQAIEASLQAVLQAERG